MICGNGLWLEIWDEFIICFGVVWVCEFYVVSEGNLVFINIFNVFRIVGVLLMLFVFVEYDLDIGDLLWDVSG